MISLNCKSKLHSQQTNRANKITGQGLIHHVCLCTFSSVKPFAKFWETSRENDAITNSHISGLLIPKYNTTNMATVRNSKTEATPTLYTVGLEILCGNIS
jgi:hypothetical protein